jgi:hypothetical protein
MTFLNSFPAHPSWGCNYSLQVCDEWFILYYYIWHCHCLSHCISPFKLCLRAGCASLFRQSLYWGTFSLYGKHTVSLYFMTAIIKFQVSIARNCWELKRCMNVSYVVGHEWIKESFVSVHHVYSMSTYNILIWYLKYSMLYKHDGLRLTIFLCCPWEMTSNINLDA